MPEHWLSKSTRSVKANGGVAVEKKVEGAWVTVDTFTADVAWKAELVITKPVGGNFHNYLLPVDG